jgi:hypothetical protein
MGREEPTLEILFDSIVSYWNIDESFRLRTWTESSGTRNGSLFTVEPSAWLRWLRNESGGVLDDVDLVHYAILTNNDCIDIAAEFPPEVRWLSER